MTGSLGIGSSVDLAEADMDDFPWTERETNDTSSMKQLAAIQYLYMLDSVDHFRGRGNMRAQPAKARNAHPRILLWFKLSCLHDDATLDANCRFEKVSSREAAHSSIKAFPDSVVLFWAPSDTMAADPPSRTPGRRSLINAL